MCNLKNCPFCGSEAKLHTNDNDYYSYIGGCDYDVIVSCIECLCEMKTHYTVHYSEQNKQQEIKEEAIKRICESWNTRHE